MILWIWVLVLVAAVTLYLRRVYSRFSRHGVKNFTPFPFLGTFYRVVFRMEHLVDDINRNYYSFPEERFVGKFEFLSPVVQLRDLELVKKIAVKDFEYFLDHRVIVNKENDPFFSRNLFALAGQEWKDMRSTLSPAFTSSKIRVMVPFMVGVGEQMIKILKQKIEKSESGYLDVDAKDLTTRYASDVIASCVFGLKVDSHSDVHNLFYVKGKEASSFTFIQLLKFIGYSSVPYLMDKLKLSLFSESTKSFFRNLVTSTIQEREARNIFRPDMIHLLMEAKKGQLKHDEKTPVDADAGFATVEESSIGKKTINRAWTDDDLIAQAVVFFVAGFETVAGAMTFLLHELSINPDVQEKLYQEIKENDAKNDGKFNYNSIQEMKYLDMVISELLRLWPLGASLDRRCIKDYNLGKPNANATEDYIIRKGEGLHIPAWSIHSNPEYYPNPSKFDPERFSEENKHNIKPFTYMPFGLGPRNCIGSRFALCEVKVMAYQLLQSMEVFPSAKTRIPIKLSKETFNINVEGGLWIKFKARN